MSGTADKSRVSGTADKSRVSGTADTPRVSGTADTPRVSGTSSRIELLGDQALRIRFPDSELDLLSAVSDACADALIPHTSPRVEVNKPAFKDYFNACIPAFDSISLRLHDWASAQAAQGFLERWLQPLFAQANSRLQPQSSAIEIVFNAFPVDSELSADLRMLAEELAMSSAQVLQRFCAGDYRVALIGFRPGFAYLSGLDPCLSRPRRASPRARLPAGTVACAEQMAGIYPCVGAGGWHVLGTTETQMFDTNREPPSLLRVGQRVRFRLQNPLH